MHRTISILALPLAFSSLLHATPLEGKPDNAPEVTIDQARFEALPAAEQQRVTYIVDRLNTIATTDMKELDRSERKALRSEVKALEREARDLNRGGTVIYLSTAGIIIIILLLIILL